MQNNTALKVLALIFFSILNDSSVKIYDLQKITTIRYNYKHSNTNFVSTINIKYKQIACFSQISQKLFLFSKFQLLCSIK